MSEKLQLICDNWEHDKVTFEELTYTSNGEVRQQGSISILVEEEESRGEVILHKDKLLELYSFLGKVLTNVHNDI